MSTPSAAPSRSDHFRGGTAPSAHRGHERDDQRQEAAGWSPRTVASLRSAARPSTDRPAHSAQPADRRHDRRSGDRQVLARCIRRRASSRTTRRSSGRQETSGSTSRSSVSRRPVTARATGWSRPTVVSSPSGRPSSTVRPVVSDPARPHRAHRRQLTTFPATARRGTTVARSAPHCHGGSGHE